MTEKEITKTIMLSVQNTDADIKTFLLPLANIQTLYQGDESVCIIPCPKEIKVSRGQFKFVSFRLTNDARSEWAGDWGDMGCFVMVQKFMNADVQQRPDAIVIKFDEAKSERDVWMPDRVRSDMYE